jgi:hypothetical protein
MVRSHISPYLVRTSYTHNQYSNGYSCAHSSIPISPNYACAISTISLYRQKPVQPLSYYVHTCSSGDIAPFPSVRYFLMTKFFVLMSGVPSAMHSSADLLLSTLETSLTFVIAYPAAVSLGKVLLQTAPDRGVAQGGQTESFQRAIREVRPYIS